MYDVIIIGAGPAGLTSALYLLRANKNILVLEAKSYGGQILNATKVENYPGIECISGFDFSNNLYNQVKKLGCNIVYETAERIEEDKTVITNKNTYKAKAVIIATGSQNRMLNMPKEKELIGKGVSYCATCDGHFYKGKTVAVYGGGNTALTDALYLADIVDKVYLIHRSNDFRAFSKYVDEIKGKNNIIVMSNTTIDKLNGENKLESITVKNNDELRDINVDALFIAIGQEPKNEMFINVIDLDNRGYAISEDGVHTKTPGIYVAGDTRVKDLRQLTTAVSDGSIAATVASKEMR